VAFYGNPPDARCKHPPDPVGHFQRHGAAMRAPLTPLQQALLAGTATGKVPHGVRRSLVIRGLMASDGTLTDTGIFERAKAIRESIHQPVERASLSARARP